MEDVCWESILGTGVTADQKADKFVNFLLSTMDKCYPERTLKVKSWITPYIKTQIAARKRIFKRTDEQGPEWKTQKRYTRRSGLSTWKYQFSYDH